MSSSAGAALENKGLGLGDATKDGDASPSEGGGGGAAVTDNRSKVEWFTGVRDDLKRRLNYKSYLSDWTDGFSGKVVAASIFMYFASIAPALSFGLSWSDKTNNLISTPEVILATAISGCITAILNGQPLMITGVTGPTMILYAAIFKVTERAGIPFLPFMGWVCVWACVMFVVLALSGASVLVETVTRFTDEIFAMLIAVIYLALAVDGMLRGFHEEEVPLASAILSVLFTFGTAYLAMELHHARTWRAFNHAIRELLASYNTFICVLVFTGLSYCGQLKEAPPERLQLPYGWDWQPSIELSANGTAVGQRRPWIVDLLHSDLSVAAIFVALAPGAVLVVLFFFDHQVSTLLAQAPQFNLKKGPSFHWDTVVLGICVLVCGVLGLPPTNGVLPQAPMHVRSLARVSDRLVNGQRVEVYDSVAENRVSPLAMSVLCGLTLLAFPAVRAIPMSVLYGLFMYFGFATFIGNQMAERGTMLLGDPKLRPDYSFLRMVPYPTVVRFTLLQWALLALIFYISEYSPAAPAFPLLIVLLIPLRIYLLPRCFQPMHLDTFDAHEDKAASHAPPADPEPAFARDSLFCATDQATSADFMLSRAADGAPYRHTLPAVMAFNVMHESFDQDFLRGAGATEAGLSNFTELRRRHLDEKRKAQLQQSQQQTPKPQAAIQSLFPDTMPL